MYPTRKATTLLILIVFTVNCINAEGDQLIDIIHLIGNSTKDVINKVIPNGEIYFPNELILDNSLPMIGGEYKVSKIRMTGITNFDFTELHYDIKLPLQLILTYNLKLRGIRATLLYTLKTYLAKLVHVKGTGDIDFNFEFDVYGDVNINLNELQVEEFQVLPKITSEFVIKGLTVGERMSGLVSRQIDEIIETLINHTVKDLINVVIGGLLKFILNALINSLIDFKTEVPGIHELSQVFKLKQNLFKTEL